jgi:hypothetical protein
MHRKFESHCLHYTKNIADWKYILTRVLWFICGDIIFYPQRYHCLPLRKTHLHMKTKDKYSGHGRIRVLVLISFGRSLSKTNTLALSKKKKKDQHIRCRWFNWWFRQDHTGSQDNTNTVHTLVMIRRLRNWEAKTTS